MHLLSDYPERVMTTLLHSSFAFSKNIRIYCVTSFYVIIYLCRYKEFADAVVLCAKLGNYTKDDELIVTRKAKAIVNCFVDSLVPPRIQVTLMVSFRLEKSKFGKGFEKSKNFTTYYLKL